MRSPERIGDECPCGSGSRQSRFFCGPNSVGTLVAVEMPEPFGPRNRDQSGSRTRGQTRGQRQSAQNDRGNRGEHVSSSAEYKRRAFAGKTSCDVAVDSAR